MNGDAGFTIEVDESYVEKTLEIGGIEDPNSNFVPGGIYYNPQTGTPYQTVVIPFGPGANEYEVWMAEDYVDDAVSGNSGGNSAGSFYDQDAAIASTPAGCRLPTKADFEALTNFYTDGTITTLLEGGSAGINLNIDGRVTFNANGAIINWNYNGSYSYYMTSTLTNGQPTLTYLRANYDGFRYEANNNLFGTKVRYIIDL